MPPVRKILMPSSTDDIRKRRALALANHDVAQIQVVGRHVDRQQRLGTAPAIDRELPRQKAEHVPAARILDHHDALEPGLVVRRKGDDELLDRRINRPEHRHAQQPALARCSTPPADHVGRERADQHDRPPTVVSDAQARECAGPKLLSSDRRTASSGRRRR